MTAEEHLAIAEERLRGPGSPDQENWTELDKAMTLSGLAHAVIALAIELGVPHAPAGSQGDGNDS